MNKGCHGVVVGVVVKIKYYIVVTLFMCFVCFIVEVLSVVQSKN